MSDLPVSVILMSERSEPRRMTAQTERPPFEGPLRGPPQDDVEAGGKGCMS
jgi:hypothetical protein